MNKIQIAALAAAAAGAIAFGIGSAIPVRADSSSGGTQTFVPARYALVQGEVNVSTLQQDINAEGGFTQKAIFRLDTTTGEVWVLQLSIVGANQPQVTSGSWMKVTDMQQLQQFQLQNQSDDGMFGND